MDVRVKRGSAQQDKGCFVALLALSLFRVLVHVYEPSYSWGNSVGHLVNAGKRYVTLSDCWSNINHRLVWLSSSKSQKVLLLLLSLSLRTVCQNPSHFIAHYDISVPM